MDVLGVRLVGLNAESGRKLLLTIAVIVALIVLRAAVLLVARLLPKSRTGERAHFWVRQVVGVLVALVAVTTIVPIWFDDPSRLASVMALVTAGLAVALQRVVTAFAAYLIILRGRVFTIGDRITMGGVRGDVVAFGFMQTTVMEMGEPPAVQSAEPAVWITSRQYTGRLVRVTNDKIFDSPVYNYTREFPYLWEEIRLPVKYDADRARAEAILLEAARRHTAPYVEQSRSALGALRERFFLPEEAELEPRVFWRLTDNWLELTLRFVTPEHGVRAIKDAMSREILGALDRAGIGIASATFEVVGVPTLRLERVDDVPRGGAGGAQARRPLA